jgi:hypothetical protein
MIKGSLRLILGEWKDTTSVQQAACAALLLALLLLPGCSELALPSEEMPAAGADPSYVNIVAHHLKTLFKNQASYDAFEISPFRWVHSLKGWAWLTCVRFQDQGHPRVYSVFLKDGRVVDGRYAVVTDACDEQSYGHVRCDEGDRDRAARHSKPFVLAARSPSRARRVGASSQARA